MKNSNLAPQGLSLTAAQSISNLMHQRALDIQAEIDKINNCSKTVKINGEVYSEQDGFPMPKSIFALIMEKGMLHGAQAFLRENMKAKENMLRDIMRAFYECTQDAPEFPERIQFTNVIPVVNEEWGWQQLTSTEMSEYFECEAYAAHIGQFIHKGGKLDKLRAELPNIKGLDWMEIKAGEKTPVMVKVHHTAVELLAAHNALATEHRKYEQRVNYFKAKVKNLVTEENARIASANATALKEIEMKNSQLMEEYKIAAEKYRDLQIKESQEFEAERQRQIKEVSALRISVDPRFKTIIDSYMSMVANES